MKRFLFLLFIVSAFCFPPLTSFAQTQENSQKTVTIYIFAREDCRHCQDEKKFLDELTEEYDFIEAKYLDIHREPYATQWREIAKLEEFPLATPLTIVGNSALSGFDTAETTGKKIERIAMDFRDMGTLTPEEVIAQGGTENSIDSGVSCNDETGICAFPSTPASSSLDVSVPFLGNVDVGAYPLPTLSFVLGFVDGFNPCALWVLVTFLLILSQSRSRKRMVLLAGMFILAQVIIYALILNIWFTTWNFVALDAIVTPIVGAIAVGGGIFFLYEWATATGTCKVVGTSKREKIVRKIKMIATSPLNPATLVAILVLALSVSIIEFACSIGIPQAFTKILEMNNIGFIEQQSFMGIYLLAYMFDDIAVFALAIYGINKIHMTAKYSMWSNFIGGILMLILGFLLIFAPEALQFV